MIYPLHYKSDIRDELEALTIGEVYVHVFPEPTSQDNHWRLRDYIQRVVAKATGKTFGIQRDESMTTLYIMRTS